MEKKMSRDEILAEAERRGYQYEQEYRDCSQCTLLVVQELFGLKGDSAIKAATGFAGGIGRMGSICGGLSGGVMALGLLFGRDLEEMKHPDAEARAKRTEGIEIGIHTIIRKLFEKFKTEYGSVLCDDIERKVIGRSFDKWNPKDREEKDRLGGHKDKCPMVVGKAARWVTELILDAQAQKGRK